MARPPSAKPRADTGSTSTSTIPDVQISGAERGWALRGDNPDGAGDHFLTYRHEDNHGLIHAALAGAPLDPPARPPPPVNPSPVI